MKYAKVMMAAVAMGLALSSASCRKGTAEKAGEKIDDAVQDTKDAAHDVKEDIKEKF